MKKIKMLLYGEPGVGKSVFALKAPKPFFVCTDGNYEWLDEFGADSNAHVDVSSWSQMKKVLDSTFDDYETIVIDLLEDAFKWCEQEYCVRNNIEHVSDVGYGKAYDATRNEFFIAISKLLAKNKHVILICHGITFTTKDRRGVEHVRYAPSSRIPDKVLDMIEGRVRYCLRCYTASEEQANGEIIKRRWLSLIPKENEFGICRGVDESKMPQDIPLDFDIFANTIGLYSANTTISQETISDDINININAINEVNSKSTSNITKTTITTLNDTTVNDTNVSNDVTTSNLDDKLAAIRAKLAALKENKINEKRI